MRTINIADATLRETESGYSFKEKIEIARHLDRLNLSVIEMMPLTNPKTDSILIKSIAGLVSRSVLSVPVSLSADSVSPAFDTLKSAKHPRLRLCVPTSPAQMEYVCHKKPDAVLAAIPEVIAQCKALCNDVEFVAEDATRSDAEFLWSAISAAIEAGATTVTVCDTAGQMLPDELCTFLKNLQSAVPAIAAVILGVQCGNEMDLATACTAAAIAAGAQEIKVSATGAPLPALEPVAHLIFTRGDALGVKCAVKFTELSRTVSQIQWTGESKQPKHTPFGGALSTQSRADVSLNMADTMDTVSKAVADLGYDLSAEDNVKVFEAFRRIAEKKAVSLRELDAIVASNALQVPPTYRLESYVINAGNVIAATAHIKLQQDGVCTQGICTGDGPIDASFLAIEQIVGHHYELDDFQIQAVTEGREAMGAALVRLRAEGKLYSGRGISTDIIGASILAYVNALNKIVFEEQVQ